MVPAPNKYLLQIIVVPKIAILVGVTIYILNCRRILSGTSYVERTENKMDKFS